MTLGQHGDSESTLLALHSATADDADVLLALAKYYIFMTKYSNAEKYLNKLFMRNEEHIEGTYSLILNRPVLPTLTVSQVCV